MDIRFHLKTLQELYRVTNREVFLVWVVSDQTINGSETGTSFRQALYFMDCGFNLRHNDLAGDKQDYNDKRYQMPLNICFI